MNVAKPNPIWKPHIAAELNNPNERQAPTLGRFRCGSGNEIAPISLRVKVIENSANPANACRRWSKTEVTALNSPKISPTAAEPRRPARVYAAAAETHILRLLCALEVNAPTRAFPQGLAICVHPKMNARGAKETPGKTLSVSTDARIHTPPIR
jgi:hypothetical protein